MQQGNGERAQPGGFPQKCRRALFFARPGRVFAQDRSGQDQAADRPRFRRCHFGAKIAYRARQGRPRRPPPAARDDRLAHGARSPKCSRMFLSGWPSNFFRNSSDQSISTPQLAGRSGLIHTRGFERRDPASVRAEAGPGGAAKRHHKNIGLDLHRSARRLEHRRAIGKAAKFMACPHLHAATGERAAARRAATARLLALAGIPGRWSRQRFPVQDRRTSRAHRAARRRRGRASACPPPRHSGEEIGKNPRNGSGSSRRVRPSAACAPDWPCARRW